MSRPYIGVIGASKTTAQFEKLARKVGFEIGKRGGILVCGGLGGVMTLAAQGAKEAGGITIGILPGFDRTEANPYIDFTIVTGLLEARNLLIVRTADVLIAIDQGYGTLAEIAFALKLKKPVIGLSSWNNGLPIIKSNTADEAVAKAWELLKFNPPPDSVSV